MSRYKEEFEKIYNEQIAASLSEIEEDRKHKLLNMLSNEFILVVCFIASLFLLGIILINCPSIICGIWFLIVLFLFVTLFVYPKCQNEAFSIKLKSMYLEKILNIAGYFEWNTPKSQISLSNINKSGLFAGGTEVNYDDCFYGKYNGVDIRINELKLTAPSSGSSRGALPFKVFQGVIIDMPFNKTIKNNSLVYSKEDLQVRGWQIRYLICSVAALCIFGLVIKAADIVPASPEFYALLIFVLLLLVYSYSVLLSGFRQKLNISSLKEVKLEDPEFGKHYTAFSSDQVEGRYLITPAFMERFKNIQTAFGTKEVKCSFVNGHLMFAIYTTKNIFEIGNLFTPLNTSKHLGRFLEEFLSVILLADHFKLDENTKL